MEKETLKRYQLELLKDQQEIQQHKINTIKEIKNSKLKDFLADKRKIVEENTAHNNIWKKIRNILKF